MPGALEGRVVLITGGGSTIGRAVALGCARAGARLVLCGRRAEPLSESARRVHAQGGEALWFSADLGQWEQVDLLCARAAAAWGGLDVLVCLAGGGGALAPLGADDPAAWERILRDNLLSTYLCARAALPHLRAAAGASILTCAGGGALLPELAAGLTAYACAKAAICRFTDQLAVELLESGVRVNCLVPGATLADEEYLRLPEAERARWSRPADTAELAVWLASSASEPLNGRILLAGEAWWRTADRAQLERAQADFHGLCLRRAAPPG